MQNTVVYLIRHSIPEYTMSDGRRVMYGPDAPLTEEGKQKAGKLGEALLAREGKPFDVIYSSPLKRAYETACKLAEKMKLNPVTTQKDLRDTDSNWGGTPMDELAEVVNAGQLFEDPRTHESPSEIADRMIRTFTQITSSHEGQIIGIVSHGDPIRLLVYRIQNPDKEIPPYPQLVGELTLDMAHSLRLEFFPDKRVVIEIVS